MIGPEGQRVDDGSQLTSEAPVAIVIDEVPLLLRGDGDDSAVNTMALLSRHIHLVAAVDLRHHNRC
jgi:hypothetical protein